MNNLWPDKIGEVALNTPLAILKEQALLLGQKTKNIVEGRVSRAQTYIPETENLFVYNFLLIAPILRNYRYGLFTIKHKINLYPVAFEIDQETQKELESKLGKWDGELTASSEDELISILREILHSEKTRRVVGSMLAQSEVYEPDEEVAF